MEDLRDNLNGVFIGILAAEREELKAIEDPAELERYWFFKYDPAASLEWNCYQFHKMLDLYSNKCRRWEESHNGSCCVVERVRDKYIMPKIREWLEITGARDPGAV
jgi:hypothetical protein